MDRIRALEAYVRLVDLGSFTAAAADLGVKQSTVSKWVAALEAEVGATLLHRTTRTRRVTDAGRAFADRARDVLAAWERAQAVGDTPDALRGRLRVGLPSVFGPRHVVPHLAAFAASHPALHLALRFDDAYADLVDQDLDVAVRVGTPVEGSHRSRVLVRGRRRLVASPGFLDAHGAPRTPEDLATRPALLHGGRPHTRWTLSRDGADVAVDVHGRCVTDHSEATRQLAVDGLGIACLADWLVRDDVAAGRLRVVLADWQLPAAPVRVVLPPARHVPARVRALVHHLETAWRGGLARG